MDRTATEAAEQAVFDEEYFVKAAEAALFAYGGALPLGRLAEAIGADEKDIPRILEAMKPRYEGTALELLRLDDCAELVTRAEYAEVVRNTLDIRRNQPLSRAALEVLAIIAYNQPATRSLVDKVRGVESPSVILSLCDKGLIEEKGRLDAPGRPMLYGTTPLFLRTFGLEHIDELDEAPELADFTRQITEQKEALLVAEKDESGGQVQLMLEEQNENKEIVNQPSEKNYTSTEADTHADEEETDEQEKDSEE